MATRSRGWTLQRDARTKVLFVRFRHAGKRFNRSTGETDRGAAQKAGARIYEEVTSGRRLAHGGKAPPLSELCGAWVQSLEADHAPRTVDTYDAYTTRFVTTFGTLPMITTASNADYMRNRLKEVTAKTVRKELSALRTFLAWLVERGVLPEAPIVPSVPKRAIGTPHDGGKRSQRRIDLSAEQMERLLERLPVRTRYGLPARDLATLIWETTLRAGTIARIETPRHYAPGYPSLRISADIDKARYARDVPISDRAREILDRHTPDTPGLLFGPTCIRLALEKAALEIGLPPEDARKVSPHDIRHAALSHLASLPNAPLAGISYIAGHLHVSTTALYVHAPRSAAEEVLAARGTRNGTPPKDHNAVIDLAEAKRKRLTELNRE